MAHDRRWKFQISNLVSAIFCAEKTSTLKYMRLDYVCIAQWCIQSHVHVCVSPSNLYKWTSDCRVQFGFVVLVYAHTILFEVQMWLTFSSRCVPFSSFFSSFFRRKHRAESWINDFIGGKMPVKFSVAPMCVRHRDTYKHVESWKCTHIYLWHTRKPFRWYLKNFISYLSPCLSECMRQ